MKKMTMLLALTLSACHVAPAYAGGTNAPTPTTLCEVKVCNKLERFTLDLGNMIGDAMGEQCFNVTLPKKDAVEGKILSSQDKSFSVGSSGLSFNPTRKSVTRVKHVIGCRTL